MKLLIALLICALSVGYLLVNSGDQSAPEPKPEPAPLNYTGDRNIYIWHDDQRHVTCWVARTGTGGGISCIPDQNIRL